jgi:hypothetical protein
VCGIDFYFRDLQVRNSRFLSNDLAACGRGDERCTKEQELLPIHLGFLRCYLARFSKTSLATGNAEKTFGQPT